MLPPISVLAEFPVAVVERVVKAKGTEEVATEYLNFLYAPVAQRILAGYFYRIHDEKIKAEFAEQFPEAKLVPVESIFGSWEKINKEHFSTGGTLDQLLRKTRQ